MVKFVKYRELSLLGKNNSRRFLSTIENHLTEAPDSAVETIKASGVCVDVYGSNQNNKLMNQVLQIAKSIGTNSNQLEQLQAEANHFNSIFEQFRPLRNSLGIEEIPNDQKVGGFLTISEIYLSAARDYTQGIEIDELRKKYPSILALIDEEGKVVEYDRGMNQTIKMAEEIMERTGEILKYFKYDDIPFDGQQDEIDAGNLLLVREHIFLNSIFERLINFYEHWRFSVGGITLGEDKNTKVEVPDLEIRISEAISNSRAEAKKTNIIYQFVQRIDSRICDPQTTKFPPEAFRADVEILSTIFFREYFGIDLEQEINGVPIREWIRSYTILHQVSEENISQRSFPLELKQTSWLVSKAKQDWIRLFVEGGLSEVNSQKILEALIFTDKSKDLLDCPLIELNGSLTLLPSIGFSLAAAESVLSNSARQQWDIAFKGVELDTRIRREVSAQGITCERILNIDENNEEFECDAVFTLGEDLFFFEIKSLVQPDNPRSFNDLRGRLIEASSQLNRVANHFVKNLELVKTALNLSAEWKPQNVYKVIITSAMLGEPLEIAGCLFVDYSILGRFIKREPLAIIFGKFGVQIDVEDYTGPITTQKLLNVISNPNPIRLSSRRLRREITNLQINDIRVILESFRIPLGFSLLSAEQIEKLKKNFGVDTE